MTTIAKLRIRGARLGVIPGNLSSHSETSQLYSDKAVVVSNTQSSPGRRASAAARLPLAGLLLPTLPAAAGEPDTAIVVSPLAARTPVQSPTLLARLDPDRTGARSENSYNEPRMWADRYEEFLFGAVGTGVAIGDFDGDMDIASVGVYDGLVIHRNESQTGNRIGAALKGTVSNRPGIGATVTREGEGWMQTAQPRRARVYLSSSELILHFGLGARGR